MEESALGTPPPITLQVSDSSRSTADEKATHEHYMHEALKMAELALATSETPVGCVFVHRATIIGRGMNATNRTRNGTMHAEVIAIAEILSTPAALPDPTDSTGAGEGEGRPNSPPSPSGSGATAGRGREKRYSLAVLKECDLYVTVEPCIMCASLLRQYGIRKVYFGARNERFGGTGGVLSIHEGRGAGWDGGEVQEGEEEEEWGMPEKGYEVSGGWLREEAILLLRRFYVGENERAPEPKSKKDRKLKTEIEPLVDLESGNP